MELDLISRSNGVIQNTTNILDAVWAPPANQAQIIAWIKARQMDYIAYPSDSTDAGVHMLVTLEAVREWIMSQYDAAWGKTPTAAASAPSVSVSSLPAVGVVAVVVAAGVLVWIFSRP